MAEKNKQKKEHQITRQQALKGEGGGEEEAAALLTEACSPTQHTRLLLL